ncbi:hypothetical protein [Fischerella thermalis]|jgi:hypothetical protein|uniref:hypothetical protein n=1 Tax=Fischerella thermalis TaxID=372787 RepID=UPI001CA52B3B|nr:hypothetical protein [Fischerella thermalis]
MKRKYCSVHDSLYRGKPMTTFQVNDTVGAIVRDRPALSRLFEQDMHQHFHKENNVLFPRAIALEHTKA